MYKLTIALLTVLAAAPLMAQRRIDFLIDAEGARRTGHNESFTPGIRFDPQFGTGGGAGVGLNFFLSDRVSIEAKAAALESRLRVRIVGSDFIATANLGRAQIFPISAVLQWHLSEHGTIRPYLGAGVAHVILRDVNHSVTSSATGIHFKDPTGFVVDGGLEFNLSKRFGIYGDARYIPVETKSTASFVGTSSSVQMNVRPLIVSSGIAWRF
jgi:outer membrane protein